MCDEEADSMPVSGSTVLIGENLALLLIQRLPFKAYFVLLSMSEITENCALWFSSFSSPLELVTLPAPTATQGSAVIHILSTLIIPYTNAVHSGKLPQLNLEPPFVSNPSAISRVHTLSSDSVKLKPGDFVFVDSTIRARDDPDIIVMQGHHGGDGEKGHRKLMREWRDGSLQQFQKVPLENCYALNEDRLIQDLKYTPAEIIAISVYLVAAGAIMEAADVKIGETIVIGPAGGSFGGAAVEVALALGANVIALGRNKQKLENMKQALGNPDRLRIVTMTGNVTYDAAVIKKTIPGGSGAEIYNDWTPGEISEPLYLAAALQAIKEGGRVVMSGGASGNVTFLYLTLLHKNLKIIGK
jgi:threonine dehydrogenase-like Zn-dependent dehydrogenase